jgi:polyisoprenyl-teichoic acid--peptidoglycan teichoic acid transferase
VPVQNRHSQSHVQSNPTSVSTPTMAKFGLKSWMGLGLGLSGVAMISATAGALFAVSLSSTPLMQSRLTPEEQAIFNKDDIANMNLKLPELTRPVNILILGTKVLTSDLELPGTESGYEPTVNSLEGLSDSMLLVRFDPKTSKVSLLSVPRDTYAWVEGLGETKINEANRVGGPALSAKTLSRLLDGVRIDRYVRVNIMAVEKLIDALGGVTVYVPKDMKYTDNTQHLYIDLKEGEQRLNGEQALQFLRYRYDGLGDIGRIQRQQTFMRALMEQSLSPATVVKLPQILSVVQEYIDTNLSLEEIVALTGFAAKISRENTQMLMLPGEFNSPATPNDPSYWLPSYEQIDAMMAEHFDRGYRGRNLWKTDASALRIAIQDSTDEPDAVNGLIRQLDEEGYRNVMVDQPWGEPLTVTRIVAQQGDAESAEQLQQDLGFGEIRIESTGSLESDITIQVGQDWLRQQPLEERSLGEKSVEERQ